MLVIAVNPAKNGLTDRGAILEADLRGPKELSIVTHMGTIWRISLNDTCSAAMRAVAAIGVVTLAAYKHQSGVRPSVCLSVSN